MWQGPNCKCDSLYNQLCVWRKHLPPGNLCYEWVPLVLGGWRGHFSASQKTALSLLPIRLISHQWTKAQFSLSCDHVPMWLRTLFKCNAVLKQRQKCFNIGGKNKIRKMRKAKLNKEKGNLRHKITSTVPLHELTAF